MGSAIVGKRLHGHNGADGVRRGGDSFQGEAVVLGVGRGSQHRHIGFRSCRLLRCLRRQVVHNAGEGQAVADWSEGLGKEPGELEAAIVVYLALSQVARAILRGLVLGRSQRRNGCVVKLQGIAARGGQHRLRGERTGAASPDRQSHRAERGSLQNACAGLVKGYVDRLFPGYGCIVKEKQAFAVLDQGQVHGLRDRTIGQGVGHNAAGAAV